MEKNFFTLRLNNRIAPGYMENGNHMNMTEEKLIAWFKDQVQYPPQSLTTIADLEIFENPEGYIQFEKVFLKKNTRPPSRIDLVLQIITPIEFEEGDIVQPVYFDPLPGNKIAPPLAPNTEYTVLETIKDIKGFSHVDIGITSVYEWIHSYETKEPLPRGNEIHWCHPGRLKLIRKKNS